MNRQRGLTLLEVLIALAIVAVALIAALRAMGSTALAASAVQERTLADWVAHDRLALHRANASFPAPGRAEGRVRQGTLEFVWQERIMTTPNALFRRIEVQVSNHDGSRVLATASGFATRPLK